jgi:hypothetical protein
MSAWRVCLIICVLMFQQADHNQDKYSLLLKHTSPSPTEFQTYIDLRYQKSIYTLTATVNLLEHKQMLLELHLDQ